MAAIRVPSPTFLSTFLPVVRARLFPQSETCQRIPLLSQMRQLQLNGSVILPAALAPIPGLLNELWDGLLKAVPKKKTSHMKKRHRQMAGKALKDVTALNKCQACGRLKRAHFLCPYCVQSIRQWFGNGFKTKAEVEEENDRMFEVYQKELRIRGDKPLERKPNATETKDDK